MAEIVVMPKIGLTAREAVLTVWLVEIGQSVSAGDPLFEIETDKITNEIEAPASGVLLKRIDPDVVVPVGEPIGVIGAPGEEVASVRLFEGGQVEEPEAVSEAGGLEKAPAGKLRPVDADTPDLGPSSGAQVVAGRAAASPVARKRASELGMDLSNVTGTGPGGRITRRDIDRAAGAGAVATVEPVPTACSERRREQPTKLRRAIAAAMSLSADVPQFSLERDVDVTELRSVLSVRSQGLADSLSVADAIGVAVARSIAKHAVFMRSWADGIFEYGDGVHLGLAVAVEDGLIVPVLRNADRLTIEAFSTARRDLQERTLAGKLARAESMGAVFSISNLGPFGVDRFRALVNPPESGILAVGRVRTVEGRLVITLNLSADHRVVDGVQGARLLMEISRFLEDQEGLRELLSPPGG